MSSHSTTTTIETRPRRKPARPERANSRINIPISGELRSQLETLADREQVSLAELGRTAIEAYLAEQLRRERVSELCAAAKKHSGLIQKVGKDWSAVETEGWSDD